MLPAVLTKRRKWLLACLILIGTAQAAIGAAGAWIVKIAFDNLHASAGQDGSSPWLALGFIAWAALAALFRIAERSVAERLGQDYVRDIRLAVYDHMASLSARALRHRSHGAMMLRFVGDLTSVRQWVSLGLARLIVAGIAVFGALAFLSYLNLWLALTTSAILLSSLLSSLWMAERMRLASVDARRHLARLAANVNEKIANISVVQAFGQTKRERRRLARQSDRVVEGMVMRASRASRLRAITDISVIFSHGGILLVGAAEVVAGRATPGLIAASMTVVGMLLPILRDLGRVGEYWQNANISRQKILEFLQIDGRIEDDSQLPSLVVEHGSIEFEGVSLDKAIVGFTTSAQPGSVTAIIGPSGAGKSTLLSLAARLIDPSEGEIRIDGQDIHAHALDSVRKSIGIVAPDLPLLRGTIERNLRYRLPHASREELERVQKLCRLDSFLDSLPQGAATRISENGRGLSSGQQQKIAIARAILGQPKILLLDEADANFDAESCAILDEVLAQHEGTTLMVTHRVDRLHQADKIWYVENGSLVDAGSYQELIDKAGSAARFLNSGAPAGAPELIN